MWHGCTNIDPKYPVRSAGNDGMDYISGLIKGLGFSVLKLEWSTAYKTKYQYQNWSVGTAASLRALVQETPMAATLADSRFNRIQVNVFSLAITEDNPWAKNWTKEKGDLIESEMYDLVVWLRNTYSNKEFILTNWEGDFQLMNNFNVNGVGISLTQLNGYRDYQRRRIRAVKKAIADTSSTTTVRYGVELNRVLDNSGFRIVRDVLPFIDPPDLVSTSTYEAIEGWTGGITNQAAMQADIQAKLQLIHDRIRAVYAGPIVSGEFGFPQEASYWPPTLNAAQLTQTFLVKAQQLGWEGCIYWQLASNELEFPNQPRGFNLYSMNAASTTVGAINAIGTFYQGYLPTAP